MVFDRYFVPSINDLSRSQREQNVGERRVHFLTLNTSKTWNVFLNSNKQLRKHNIQIIGEACHKMEIERKLWQSSMTQFWITQMLNILENFAELTPVIMRKITQVCCCTPWMLSITVTSHKQVRIRSADTDVLVLVIASFEKAGLWNMDRFGQWKQI